MEHVTFLGSKRRESLLGTGARANAYTDFHHTVFHVHAPVRNAITNTDMLPQVGGVWGDTGRGLFGLGLLEPSGGCQRQVHAGLS